VKTLIFHITRLPDRSRSVIVDLSEKGRTLERAQLLGNPERFGREMLYGVLSDLLKNEHDAQPGAFRLSHDYFTVEQLVSLLRLLGVTVMVKRHKSEFTVEALLYRVKRGQTDVKTALKILRKQKRRRTKMGPARSGSHSRR